MAKKKNVYDSVSYDKLRIEVNEIISYLTAEETKNLKDSVHERITANGGIIPSVTVTIEEKIETQVGIIESSCKILKSLLDKEGLSSFVRLGIESLTMKLAEIQEFYQKQPLSQIKDRKLKLNYGKGKIIESIVQPVEKQVKYRTRISEKILKILPLISELESLKEAIQVKGGYEIPYRMKIKRQEQTNG
jgi:hypothetical protein